MHRRAQIIGLMLPLLSFVAISSTLAFQGNGTGPSTTSNAPYAIGLWGDVPYSETQANVGVPNMIADMNSQKLAFSVHNGDLKQGSNSLCDDALYIRSLGYFNSLEAPAIFTPGDNDWTDCDRANNGGYSSLERLSRERQVFFLQPYTLGQRTFLQEVQATPPCLGETASHTRLQQPCSENRRWTYGRVLYATLNIAGSCNNLCDTNPDPDEYAARNAANIAWMKETFKAATGGLDKSPVAIMFISQANPGFDQSDPTRAPLRNPQTLEQTDGQPDGFQSFLVALRDEVIAFRKPVAWVHGDSHYLRIDRPFLDSQGRRLENFTRVETFGNNAANLNNDVNWLKVLVDPRSREVFAYQAQIVPGNRIAVPAP
jgi:hypothetical protein